jgi:nucleoside-diphosphate-sugar epimerase
MTNSSYVFLAGASRGVGREVARYLRETSVSIKAMVRSSIAQVELEAMGIAVAQADALDAQAVEQIIMADPVWAVISTIGGLPQQGQRADYLGNRHLIDAAVKAGVDRFILVSSIGSGESAVALPPQALQTLGEVLAEKHRAEQYLIQSGLNYTIIRPGGLKSEAPTGQGVLTTNPTVSGTIHRADVAQLVCQCLVSCKAEKQVFSAIDRNQTYTQTQFEVVEL